MSCWPSSLQMDWRCLEEQQQCPVHLYTCAGMPSVVVIEECRYSLRWLCIDDNNKRSLGSVVFSLTLWSYVSEGMCLTKTQVCSSKENPDMDRHILTVGSESCSSNWLTQDTWIHAVKHFAVVVTSGISGLLAILPLNSIYLPTFSKSLTPSNAIYSHHHLHSWWFDARGFPPLVPVHFRWLQCLMYSRNSLNLTFLFFFSFSFNTYPLLCIWNTIYSGISVLSTNPLRITYVM